MAIVHPTATPVASEAPPTPTTVPCSPDALLGMSWWNRITESERARWLEAAGSFIPAAAWAAYKAGGAK